jgi:outer membrane protein OmpA-like peptidoglycan-associated protein
MLVFLLLSIFVMAEIQKKDNEKKIILIEYNNSKDDLYKELKKAFEEKKDEWQMEIEDDLTIKFTNPDVLFEANDSKLRIRFKNILEEFVPKYLSIINEAVYKDKIKEIRIE